MDLSDVLWVVLPYLPRLSRFHFALLARRFKHLTLKPLTAREFTENFNPKYCLFAQRLVSEILANSVLWWSKFFTVFYAHQEVGLPARLSWEAKDGFHESTTSLELWTYYCPTSPKNSILFQSSDPKKIALHFASFFPGASLEIIWFRDLNYDNPVYPHDGYPVRLSCKLFSIEFDAGAVTETQRERDLVWETRAVWLEDQERNLQLEDEEPNPQLTIVLHDAGETEETDSEE